MSAFQCRQLCLHYNRIGIAALQFHFNFPNAMPIQSVSNVGITMQAIGFTLESHWHAPHWN